MISRIVIEIKLLIKSKKFKLLLVFMTLLPLLFFERVATTEEWRAESLISQEEVWQDTTLSTIEAGYLSESGTELLEEQYELSLQAVKSIEKQDWKQYNLTKIKITLIDLREIENLYANSSTSEKELYNKYLQRYEYVQEVEEIVNYELDSAYYKAMSDDYREATVSLYDDTAFFQLKYYVDLYEGNQIPQNFAKNSMTLLVVYCMQIAPILIILISFILIGDGIKKDASEGILKTTFIIDGERKKYILAKIIAGTTVAFMLIFGPAIIITCINSWGNMCSEMNYPIYYYEDGVRSVQPMFEFTNSVQDVLTENDYSKTYNFNGPYQESLIYYKEFWSHEGFIASTSLVNVGLLKFIALTLSMNLLLVFFIITAIINVSVMALNTKRTILYMILFLGVCFGISELCFGSTLASFIPTSYLSVVSVLQGTVPYTYFTGIIVISTFTIILIFASLWIFDRKDIS